MGFAREAVPHGLVPGEARVAVTGVGAVVFNSQIVRLVFDRDIAVLDSVHTFAVPGHPVTAAFCAFALEVAVYAFFVEVRADADTASCCVFIVDPVEANLTFRAFPVFVFIPECRVIRVGYSLDSCFFIDFVKTISVILEARSSVI